MRSPSSQAIRMANALGRDINPGEVVVISGEIMAEAYADVEDRLFRCRTGLGLLTVAADSHIGGMFLVDGDDATMSGLEIDPAETRAWQGENGRFGRRTCPGCRVERPFLARAGGFETPCPTCGAEATTKPTEVAHAVQPLA